MMSIFLKRFCLRIVKNLYFPVDYGTDDVVVARGVELVSVMFSDILIRGNTYCMHPNFFIKIIKL